MNHTLLSLPTFLAQISESADGFSVPTTTQVHVNPAVFVIAGLVGFAAFLLGIITMWKTFTKAGQPGWASIIPFYNLSVICRVAGKPGWWWLLLCIPFVGFIFSIIVCIGLAEKFGRSTGFGIGLALLSPIFFPILAFGDSQYQVAAPAPGYSPVAA